MASSSLDDYIDVAIALDGDLLLACPEEIAVWCRTEVEKARELVEDVDSRPGIKDYGVLQGVLGHKEGCLGGRDKARQSALPNGPYESILILLFFLSLTGLLSFQLINGINNLLLLQVLLHTLLDLLPQLKPFKCLLYKHIKAVR